MSKKIWTVFMVLLITNAAEAQKPTETTKPAPVTATPTKPRARRVYTNADLPPSKPRLSEQEINAKTYYWRSRYLHLQEIVDNWLKMAQAENDLQIAGAIYSWHAESQRVLDQFTREAILDGANPKLFTKKRILIDP